jgi:hypothetical protein
MHQVINTHKYRAITGVITVERLQDPIKLKLIVVSVKSRRCTHQDFLNI